MNSERIENADVVVVGGGPGGSTLASLVALQGHRVILLEKEKFPRYQIGESLLPATVRGVCHLTGVAGKLDQAGFVRKRGGTFRWGSNPEPWTFSFSVSPKMESSSSYAYQVERSRFDKILLDHAAELGTDVRERCAVTDVIGDEERVRGVRYLDAGGVQREILARYVVDASGSKSRIYKHAGGSRKYSQFFRSLALFGYYEGGKRLAPPNAGNILCAAFESGWFWYIPLSDTLTSVGAVVRRELADKIQGDPGQALAALIAECPIISDYLGQAQRINEGQYGSLRVRKDYSYHNTKFWRPGLVLIGDAACFVDPIFSSGVHLATYSALLGARSINSALAHLVDEETGFGEFERRYRHEYRTFYEFLVSFYDMNHSADSYFWTAKKITNDTSSELESFVSLVGGVSSGDAAVTNAEFLTQRFKGRAKEVADAVDEFVAIDEANMLPWFKSSLIREATAEMEQVQTLAVLGGRMPAGAMRAGHGGLAPSPDGMFWQPPGAVLSS
jgi:halogenation protein CepH